MLINCSGYQRFTAYRRQANMYRNLLFLGGAFFLFSNFSCPDQCDEEFGSPRGQITAQIENPQSEAYAVGESIWLSASFSAEQRLENDLFTISENGGFVSTEVFQVLEDSLFFNAALGEFAFAASEGIILPLSANGNPAAVTLQYACSGGNCSFRQRFEARSPGTYVLRVLGGAVDEVSAPFRYCVPPAMEVTSLGGGGNIPSGGEDRLIQTELVSSFFWEPISTQNQANVYYFTVE